MDGLYRHSNSNSVDLLCGNYVLTISVDDDAPFALSPSILMLFASFSYQTKSVQICCLFECSKFTCSIVSSLLDLQNQLKLF